MATCYQKHPFEIESEDHLTAINTKIFEIKKKIQLSEGQRKSHFEENEADKQENSDLIDMLKKEIKSRVKELAQARALIGEDEIQVKKYLNEVCPIGKKTADQIIHNLDLKVIEQRKMLDLLKYERKTKKSKLKVVEKEYESLLIDNSRSTTEKIKCSNPDKKQAAHLENEIHKVFVQWNEAELVKKKYSSIRQALTDDSIKFESSLSHMTKLLNKQRDEIANLECVRWEALELRTRTCASLGTATARARGDERARAADRGHFAQGFTDRKRELEKLEKRIFPPPARGVVRRESAGSTETSAVNEETSALNLMEDTFRKLMKLTGVTEAEMVFDRFRAQRETAKRLSYLQQSTELDKLELEQKQTNLVSQLEAFKFAQCKDKDETQDQINELKVLIDAEEEKCRHLEEQLDKINNMLLDIKKLLYDLCKLLECVVQEPPLVEWTAEARDVSGVAGVLRARRAAAAARAHLARERGAQTHVSSSRGVSVPTSGAASAAGVSPQSHSTPRESDAPAPVPTYKELLQREPVRAPASDEEEDIPSRSYLKRQAQLIVDTKSRRKGFRPPFPRK